MGVGRQGEDVSLGGGLLKACSGCRVMERGSEGGFHNANMVPLAEMGAGEPGVLGLAWQLPEPRLSPGCGVEQGPVVCQAHVEVSPKASALLKLLPARMLAGGGSVGLA